MLTTGFCIRVIAILRGSVSVVFAQYLLYRIIGAETVAGITDKVPVLADSIGRQDPVAVRTLVLFGGFEVAERFAADHAPCAVIGHRNLRVLSYERAACRKTLSIRARILCMR